MIQRWCIDGRSYAKNRITGSPSSLILKRGAVRGARLSGRSGFALDSKDTTWTRMSSLISPFLVLPLPFSRLPLEKQKILPEELSLVLGNHTYRARRVHRVRQSSRECVLRVLEGAEQPFVRARTRCPRNGRREWTMYTHVEPDNFPPYLFLGWHRKG